MAVEILDRPTPLQISNYTPCLRQRGDMTVRLAKTPEEVRAAQALRYQVFYEELNANASPHQLLVKRDYDDFDALCDHLLLIVSGSVPEVTSAARLANGDTVIGCYRLLRKSVAAQHGGFYSAQEFDLSALLAGLGGELEGAELGRSCVAPSFRARNAIDLLWQGLADYAQRHGVDFFMGCASFPTTDVNTISLPLSYLSYKFSTPTEWYVRALPHRAVSMRRLPITELDERLALRALPPVLRGYIRAGCMVGDGAVVDHAFSTTDVFVVLPLQCASQRYLARYN